MSLTLFPQIFFPFQAVAELIILERRDIFLAAVFLWITPFLAALSITDCAAFSFSDAVSPEFSLTASSTSLVIFFTLVFTDLLRIRLISL